MCAAVGPSVHSRPAGQSLESLRMGFNHANAHTMHVDAQPEQGAALAEARVAGERSQAARRTADAKDEEHRRHEAQPKHVEAKEEILQAWSRGANVRSCREPPRPPAALRLLAPGKLRCVKVRSMHQSCCKHQCARQLKLSAVVRWMRAHVERREEAVEELEEPPHNVDCEHNGQQHRAAQRDGQASVVRLVLQNGTATATLGDSFCTLLSRRTHCCNWPLSRRCARVWGMLECGAPKAECVQCGNVGGGLLTNQT